jgi:hypothetical protein
MYWSFNYIYIGDMNLTMHVERALCRDRTDRRLPVGVLTKERRPRGRRKDRFRLALRDRSDVACARRAGLPLHLVTPDDVAAFGFPMTFPARLVVGRSLVGLVDTPFPVHPMEAEPCALRPRVEDLIVVMLKVDPYAARAIGLRNPAWVDPDRLLRRVIQEGCEREATLVRLQEIAPGIPVEGRALPIAGLRSQDRNNTARGLL